MSSNIVWLTLFVWFFPDAAKGAALLYKAGFNHHLFDSGCYLQNHQPVFIDAFNERNDVTA